MPIVSSFDGVNRQIVLDNSVANTTWKPIDLYIEYLQYRRDNEQFRGFEPLIIMRNGQPKGGGQSAPRFLQMLTDRRAITTKLILPDIGPYRTRVDGEILTDVPDTDPEPFDISGLTTAVIIDYKPAEAEIITLNTGSAVLPSDITEIIDGVWLKNLGSDIAQNLLNISGALAQADTFFDQSAGLMHFYYKGTTTDIIPPKNVTGTEVTADTGITE